MITLFCCLLVSFISGFLLAYNLREKTSRSSQDCADYKNLMSLLSSQDNTFSLMSLVFLLFISSEKSTNFFSQE